MREADVCRSKNRHIEKEVPVILSTYIYPVTLLDDRENLLLDPASRRVEESDRRLDEENLLIERAAARVETTRAWVDLESFVNDRRRRCNEKGRCLNHSLCLTPVRASG